MAGEAAWSSPPPRISSGTGLPKRWVRSSALGGGEIKEYSALIEDTRRNAIDRLVVNASAMGADAVVMMRFDSGEIGQTMSEVVAYGTAVRLEKQAVDQLWAAGAAPPPWPLVPCWCCSDCLSKSGLTLRSACCRRGPGPAWHLVLATVFERRYRGAPTSRDAPAPGWEATGETFRDEENGKWVRVWFHPASGERRYVATDSPRP
jgi:hypothetical protein